MSRHRNVKQLIEDDYYDDYDDYDDGYTGGSASIQAKKKQPPKANQKQPVKPQPNQNVDQQKQVPQRGSKSPTPTPTKTSGISTTPEHPPGFSATSTPPAAAAKPAPASGTKSASGKPPPIPAILLASDHQNGKKLKIPLTVVVLGHVDAGKSTVTGNLLYGAKNISKSTARNNTNKPVNYAWLLDEDEQERAHGVTMDIATKQLEDALTSNFQIVLQDAPGHADYVPAMITGTASADAALLTVDATDLSTAIQAGQLREHVYLARGLGVNQILVVLNKMDVVGWDNEAAYRSMEQLLTDFLTKKVGYPAERVRCIPVSGLTGTNIFPGRNDDDADTAQLRLWYKGPTLLEALDSFEPPVQQQQKLLEKPLRIVVADVLESSGGVGLRAKVVSGFVKQGETLVVLPVGDEAVITKLNSLHLRHQLPERRQYCVAGEMLDCAVTGIDAQRLSTGSILARPGNRPPLAFKCRAKVFILDGLQVPLIRGAQMIFHMHHLDIPCHLAVLIRTLKPDGTTPLKERPRALTKSCTAIVELQLAVPVCMEAFTDCRALGRFVLRRGGDSIAVGRIEQVLL
jgi:elongation factor 1 alpha-like protein